MSTSLNGVVIYKSRYGATLQYAEWIKEALGIPLIDPERLDAQVLSHCDFLIIGAPVYTGEMLIKSWLDERQPWLLSKKLIFFVVCTNHSDAEKRREMIKDNIPASLLPYCSIHFLPGRIILKDLTPKDEMLLGLGAWAKKDARQKEMPSEESPSLIKADILPVVDLVRSL